VAVCTAAPADVRTKIEALLQSKGLKKEAKAKRDSSAAEAIEAIVEEATLGAIAKRSRASASSGPAVGPLAAAFMRQNKTIDADALCSTAIANLIHSRAFSEGLGQDPLFLDVLEKYKDTSASYSPPNAAAVGGPLLDSLSSEYYRHTTTELGRFKEDFGLAATVDGATIHHCPLINILAVVCCIVVLLEIVDCTGYMAAGGTKDGPFIAEETNKQMIKIGIKYFYLVIFDGASNMVLAGQILMALSAQITLIHCALHIVHLIFGDIAHIAEVARLISEYKVIRAWVVSHHFQNDLFKRISIRHFGSRPVSFPVASDTRMGGHFMCLFRLLRYRPVLIQMVNDPVYIGKNFSNDPLRAFVMDENNWRQIFSLLRVVWPLIPLLRLGDTNGATMGHQYKAVRDTKELINRAISSDTTPFMVSVSPHIKAAFEQRELELSHDFAIAAFLLCPKYVDEAKAALEKEPKLIDSLELIAGRVFSSYPAAERDAAVASVVEETDRLHRKAGNYMKPHLWVSSLLDEGQNWHSTYSRHNPHMRKLGMIVLSKPIGAGAPERNWADVKTVWDSTKGSMSPEKMEKKVIIYGAAHRTQSLTGEEEDVSYVWTVHDEVWEDLGLSHYDQGIAALAAAVQARRFQNRVQEEHVQLITDPSRVAEAKLIKNYKGIRFYDEDEDGGYFRIRSDRFSWKGKKAGGWAVVCDMMPDDDPAHDPEEDADIIEDEELVEYVINSSLHEMISAARQSQGILIVEDE